MVLSNTPLSQSTVVHINANLFSHILTYSATHKIRTLGGLQITKSFIQHNIHDTVTD